MGLRHSKFVNSIFGITEAGEFLDEINIGKKKPVEIPKGRSKYILGKGVEYNAYDYSNRNYAKSRKDLLFKPPEYDLKTIALLYDTESIFRQAIEKYQQRIWRNGFNFVSEDPKSRKYIWKRFEEFRENTKITTYQLLKNIANDLLVHGNAFIEKIRTRNSDLSMGKKRKLTSGKTIYPIAGYKVVDPSTMWISKRKNGRIQGYEQRVKYGKKKPFWKKRDMIHITLSKKTGMNYGTPLCLPAIDDIKTLRKIEEYLEILTLQYSLPLYLYKIGDENNPVTKKAIAKMQSELADMPKYSTLVSPYHHQIEAVGAQNVALELDYIIEYFRKRVYTGLGLDEVTMGHGDSSNRNTAESLTENMIYAVTDKQQVLMDAINEFMIKELLREGPSGLEKVEIRFPEVDFYMKQAREIHAATLYEKHGITESEFRDILHRDEIDDEERKDMFFDRVQKPLAKIKKGLPANGQLDSMTKPENQHGKKPKPKIAKDSQKKINMMVNDFCSKLNAHGKISNELNLIKLKLRFEQAMTNIYNKFGYNFQNYRIEDDNLSPELLRAYFQSFKPKD